MRRVLGMGASVVLLFSLLVACTQQDRGQSNNGAVHDGYDVQWKARGASTEAEVFRFVDLDGQPLSDAQVMFGAADGDPFSGNVVTTDKNGEVAIPAQFTAPLPVTVSRTGYVRTTFMDVEPVARVFEVSEEDGPGQIEIKGKTTEYGRLPSDGKVDFALVLPALTRRQLLNFDITSVMSPETDRLSVGPKDLDVPSNISLPDQRESYILPLRINKPDYRLFVRKPGFYRVTAFRGQFPLKTVVNELRNGQSVFDVINHFTFLGGGQLQLQADKALAGQNIAVNQIAFDQTVKVTAPGYAKDHVMLSLALYEQSGYLFPSDLKRVSAGQSMTLKSPASADAKYVLSLLTTNNAARLNDLQRDQNTFSLTPKSSQDETKEPMNVASATDFLSFVLQPADVTTAPLFLNHINKPEISAGGLVLHPPAEIEGVMPVGTHLVLSAIEKVGSIERRTRLWEVSTLGWVDRLNLPGIDWGHKANQKYRWEVMYLGQAVTGTSDSLSMNNVTHVTRSTIDF